MEVEPRIARRGWAGLPESVRRAARARCTPAQLDVLKLAAAGDGTRRAGRILGISREAARARLEAGMDKIRDELGAVDE